jgi:hypothetical protein
MIGGMSDAEQVEQFAWMHARGHTTIPIAVHNDYPRFPQWTWDWWDWPEKLVAFCGRATAEGFDLLLMLHPKPGRTMRDHLTAVRSLWPDLQGIAGGVCWGFEINDLGGEWANGDRQLDYLKALKTIVGATPLYVHFTPERWAGWPGFDGNNQDDTEIDWLRRAGARGVRALLYQEPPDKPVNEQLERMLEIPSPFGWSPGIAGRVVDGAGLQFVAFEFARDERKHAETVARLQRDGRVTGWC